MKNFKNYNDYSKKEELAFESKTVHGALGHDPMTGAVSFPIFQSATFRHIALGQDTGYSYSRVKNPTREELERTMAILEEGIAGFAVSSGMAAVTCVLSLLNPGDHIILSDDLYGGTLHINETFFSRYGIEFSQVDMSDLKQLNETIKPNTKMIFVETPTNPMMKVADIKEISKIAKSINAVMVVDNTFLTPYYQKPLTLGADIVIHSGTKYLGGHNDTLAGIIVVKKQEHADFIFGQVKTFGNQIAPLDAWLILRGLKTLTVRMKQHNENAIKVANWLRKQPKVKEVYFVGFEDHPQYSITKEQTTGFGGMISFAVDSEETAKKILEKVDLIMFAESLGGTETLITYPLTQTHNSVPEEIREKLGITGKLLRLSVGIEKAEDIIQDLENALK